MKSFQVVHDSVESKLNYNDIFSSSLQIKKIEEPLIDDDIIFLQEKFLTSGFIKLLVLDINTGREISSKILNSLNCYNDIAILNDCLNSSQNKYIENYFNISNSLINEDDKEIDENQVRDFFLDQFYFDFLLIELTSEFACKNWVKKFERNILDFNFHKMIPIIILTYENC